MKIIKCINPADTALGEIIYGVRYLSLRRLEYQYGMNETYRHYGIFINQGIFFDFSVARFIEEGNI